MFTLILKKTLNYIKTLFGLASSTFSLFVKKKTFNSAEYWEQRYVSGGNSGEGSYGKLAEFKAKVINDFVKTNQVKSVIEFGCGDGNQLTYFKIPFYLGLDVSKQSIMTCIEKYKIDKNKSFFLYDPLCFVDNSRVLQTDATFSLDVIYHLVEDAVFNKYMHDLFSSSNKYVVIYSSNTNEQKMLQAQHVRNRKFSDFIENNYLGWKLKIKINSELIHDESSDQESYANFYIYEKSN